LLIEATFCNVASACNVNPLTMNDVKYISYFNRYLVNTVVTQESMLEISTLKRLVEYKRLRTISIQEKG
jgi:hypothetical protein